MYSVRSLQDWVCPKLLLLELGMGQNPLPCLAVLTPRLWVPSARKELFFFLAASVLGLEESTILWVLVT